MEMLSFDSNALTNAALSIFIFGRSNSEEYKEILQLPPKVFRIFKGALMISVQSKDDLSSE